MKNLIVIFCLLGFGIFLVSCEKSSPEKLSLKVNFNSNSEMEDKINFSFDGNDQVKLVQHGMYGDQSWGAIFEFDQSEAKRVLVILDASKVAITTYSSLECDIVVDAIINGQNILGRGHLNKDKSLIIFPAN